MKILLVHASGLHLGYLGCYGNDWVSTPAIDKLAAESVVFDRHIADCLGQWPSAWTGLYHFRGLNGAAPDAPGLDELLPGRGIPVTRVTEAQLAGPAHVNPDSYHDEIRQALGSAFAAMSGKVSWLMELELPPLAPPWLVSEEFLVHYFKPDETTTPTGGQPGDDSDEVIDDDAEGEATPEEDASDDTESDDHGGPEEAGILWPLLDPPVGEIDPEADGLEERLQLSYAAAVSQCDAYVQTVLEQLTALGWPDDLLLIFTSDRGLALGEHGLLGDARPWLHDELVHIPLLMRLPGAAEAGRRAAALTQPVDLFPTILEAFGVTAPGRHGHSLSPLLRGQGRSVRDYACAGLQLDQDVEWSLHTPDWSLLLPEAEQGQRPPQLYAKPEDRWEMNNLRQQNLDLAERLEQVLRDWTRATTSAEMYRPPPLTE